MDTKRKRIMTIDDDSSVRETIRLTLEMENYEVVEARNGQEALTLLHTGQLPAVILCDWSMGGGDLDGGHFLVTAKHDPRLSKIPVVVVSGTADRFALKMGAARVISKPFDLDTLLGVIKSVYSDGTRPPSSTP